MPELRELLDVAVEAAYLGGRRTLAYFNAGVAVETKADLTPVTVADREAEEIIRGHITARFPGHSIIGEEAGETEGDGNVRWIVDPIDGTKTFIRGVPLYGTLIGVEVDGIASVGVIYLPALNEMISAATGLGCWWNGRRARVNDARDLQDAAVMVTEVETMRARGGAYDNLASDARFVRSWGDCYGYALVATGRADVMVDPALNLWDSAPLLPIVEEAGGRFTSWSGERGIRVPDGVATNGHLHEQVLARLGTVA